MPNPDWNEVFRAAVAKEPIGFGMSAETGRAMMLAALAGVGAPEEFEGIVAALIPFVSGDARDARIIADAIDVLTVNESVTAHRSQSALRALKEALWGRLNSERVESAGDRDVWYVPFSETLLRTGLHRLAIAQLGDSLGSADLEWVRGLTASAPILVLNQLLRQRDFALFTRMMLVYSYQGWISDQDLALHWENWNSIFRSDYVPELTWRNHLTLHSNEKDRPGVHAFRCLSLSSYYLLLESSGRSQSLPHIFSGSDTASALLRLADLTYGESNFLDSRELGRKVSAQKLELERARYIEREASHSQKLIDEWLAYFDIQEGDGLMTTIRGALSLPSLDPLRLVGGRASAIAFIGRKGAA